MASAVDDPTGAAGDPHDEPVELPASALELHEHFSSKERQRLERMVAVGSAASAWVVERILRYGD